MALTTGGPMVRLGTKWPSMTSICRRSASAATASMAWARAAKSADRIDGATRTMAAVTLPGGPQTDDVHPVSARGLRKQAGSAAQRLPRRCRRGHGDEVREGLGQPQVDA